MADLSDIVLMYAESIAELNRQLKELQSESESIKLEINGFQGEYAKEVKTINQRIDDLNVQVDRTIKEAIKELPEGITEDDVKKLFEGYLNELDLDSKVEQLKTELQDYIVNSIPEVKDYEVLIKEELENIKTEEEAIRQKGIMELKMVLSDF